KFLAEKLQLEVKKVARFERLSGEGVTGADLFNENLLTFPVAYGLALQGLKLSKLHTNLLPQEIQFDRMIRAKKPWAVAAAAALFLGAGILAGGYAVNYRAVSADTIKKAMEQGDAAIKKVQSINGTAAAKEADVKTLTDQA